ncbi:hypothetical protein F4780DRAFT_783655 [Xylariomycetidae sp. FL0641]|nr:hypothetical protein F4780DRAFT_783655 [Xylariomycetidae sp. FL0641]
MWFKKSKSSASTHSSANNPPPTNTLAGGTTTAGVSAALVSSAGVPQAGCAHAGGSHAGVPAAGTAAAAGTAPPGHTPSRRTPTDSSYYDLNGQPWRKDDPNAQTWIYAREVRAQQANAPPLRGPDRYPSRYNNAEKLPLTTPGTTMTNKKGSVTFWIHQPIIPGQTSAYDPDVDAPEAIRTFYTEGDNTKFDVGHHDKRVMAPSGRGDGFSLAKYVPAAPKPAANPQPAVPHPPSVTAQPKVTAQPVVASKAVVTPQSSAAAPRPSVPPGQGAPQKPNVSSRPNTLFQPRALSIKNAPKSAPPKRKRFI